MPTLPTYAADHRSDTALLRFKLVKILTAVPQCLTDCDIPITHDGNTYQPAVGLVVGGLASSQEDRSLVSANIRIGNGDGYWGALLTALAYAERNPQVQVFDAWLDPANPLAGAQAVRGVLLGAVEGKTWTTLEAELTIGQPADQKAATLPWRAISTRCTYRKFKGLQCGYAGAATGCDRSYTTCQSLGNQARFGGCRSLPEADPAEITVTVWNESRTGYADITFSVPKEK